MPQMKRDRVEDALDASSTRSKVPSRRPVAAVRFCSVWQIDTAADVPRFITMCPR
jgi:hypothetical protein